MAVRLSALRTHRTLLPRNIIILMFRVNNIKMDLGETRWGGTDWTNLAQDRNQWKALVKVVMNLRVP
jgi:hypothetical protein